MGEVGDDHAAAIAEQFESFSEEAFGRDLPEIDGDEINAIVEDIEEDELFAAGGKCEAGGFRMTIKEADSPGGPDEMADVLVRGKTLSVLSRILSNGYWKVIVGDPVA